ncbi:MAG: biotin/lipoyl-binding protein [Eubacteriaceae bacterium]|jgi:pyruvate/2-oxoglutarate dehydrogenase complex dihydrolipoamide acyltransferase (E2) component|nr:biotin/lipoyl-binding protein [Eubacteriaceae bacterium]
MIVIMPQVGMTMVEGTINEWKVQEGDKVRKGDIIMEYSTEKLTNEIEAPVSGTIHLLAEEEDDVPCGGAVAEITED